MQLTHEHKGAAHPRQELSALDQQAPQTSWPAVFLPTFYGRVGEERASIPEETLSKGDSPPEHGTVQQEVRATTSTEHSAAPGTMVGETRLSQGHTASDEDEAHMVRPREVAEGPRDSRGAKHPSKPPRRVAGQPGKCTICLEDLTVGMREPCVKERAQSVPARSSHRGHPPLQRPTRVLRPTLRAREESPRRIDAEERLRRRFAACLKSPVSAFRGATQVMDLKMGTTSAAHDSSLIKQVKLDRRTSCCSLPLTASYCLLLPLAASCCLLLPLAASHYPLLPLTTP